MSYTIKSENGNVYYNDGGLVSALIGAKNFIENNVAFTLVEDSYLPEFVDVILIDTYSDDKFLHISDGGQLELISCAETLARIEEVIKRG